jgi:hypothetical protein
MRDAQIETYSHVQACIDEHHRILNLVLSEHVPVDPRIGLRQMSIYLCNLFNKHGCPIHFAAGVIDLRPGPIIADEHLPRTPGVHPWST